MKNLPFVLFFLNIEYWILNSATAKNFGVHGHTFEIEEPDLLKAMESKLKTLEATDKLAEINETFLKRAQAALSHPTPVAGITKVIEERTFTYDPSMMVPYDLKDHEGRPFHKAGTRINPLAFQSLPTELVFIDGSDKTQVAWAEKTYLKSSPPPKIILTAGSPFQLMEQWAQPVYFDQGGKITKKLGIRHVPAVVVQDGLKLKISEIVIEEDRQ